ncbi:MAG: protein kinase [Acidobacteriia bacterium]|nr:protein kinase [Terriglobia bacterium]
MVSDTISHYKLIEKIGKGGMGVVWKARDTLLDREVALKFLPEATASDPSRRERFFREAKAASALNHPNIVTIYEINSADGCLFIAMELVRGRSLSGLLRKRKRLMPGVAADYAVQLCDGLGAAHRAGIVHRDIKPSNVMVTHEGLIKILDFGLAKLTAPVHEADVHPADFAEPLTVAGTVVGTVPYMSPEQIVGDTVGPRSDVFSFGVVLYEMLSGQRPFQGSSNAETIRALLAADPPSLLSIAADLPEPLVAITQKCLQKRPDARYPDAGEIAAQLRALDRKTWQSPMFDLSTVTMTVRGLLPAPTRKRHVLLAAATVLALALALVGGYLRWPIRKDAVPTHPVAAHLTTADALQRAQAYLQRYDRKGNVDRAIATLEPASGRDASNAALHAALGEAYVRKYAQTSDKNWLKKATESGRKAVAVNTDLAAGHVALAMAMSASGRPKEAAGEFERARDLNPLSGPAHLGLAKLRSGQEAERLYQKAVQYSPDDWIPLTELAGFYSRAARYDENIATLRHALQLAPDNVYVMAFLAAGLHLRDQYEEAADVLQHALALDPAYASAWTNLGTARYFQGRYLDAVRAMERAVELAPGRYLYWGNLGDTYRRVAGMEGKAAEAYKQAIRLVRERLAVTPDDFLRSSLAVYLAKSGDETGALSELAQVDQAQNSDMRTLFKASLVYELTQDRDKALKALARAIRAGYSMREVTNEPELAALRRDARYAAIASAAVRNVKQPAGTPAFRNIK